MPTKGDNPITPIFILFLLRLLLDCCFVSVSCATAPHPSTSRPKISPIKFVQKPGSSTKPFEDRGNVFMETQEAVETQNQEPASSSSAILGVGLTLILVTLAAIFIDYCKHLKKTGVFHKVKKIEEIEALRRQALIASTEVSLGIANRQSTNTVQQPPLPLDELAEEPESEGEIQIYIPKSHHVYQSQVDPQMDNQSESARLVTCSNQKGQGSGSSNKKRHSFLKQLSSRSVSSNGSRMSLKTKAISTSNSINMQNQSVFMMKNYGTFDSDLELEFFNETAPHLETVTKHLPKKGQTLSMLLNKKPSFDEITLISSPTTPTANKAFEYDDGSGSDMKISIATTDALHRDSTRTLLTPPNFLAIYKKSSSDTNFLMSDLKFQTPSTSSFYDSSMSMAIDDDGASVCIADRSENGKWSSMTTRLLQRELSSLSTIAMKRSNHVKAHTPTASADRMHARLMQLYQDLPVSPRSNVRASSFSQVFESKKRLQSIEAQRRRKRAEALRKRKRRLHTKSNGSLSSPGFGGDGGNNKPQMMFISRMRVPLNKRNSISLFS